MASFRGAFVHQMDGKGRLALPKPFRRVTGVKQKGVAEGPVLVLTKGFNSCVAVYTQEDWPRVEEKLKEELFTDQESRDFVLELAEQTFDVPIDTVGRILIPTTHIRNAGLERNQEVLVLGMFDHIELWNPERYQGHISGSETSFEDRAKIFFGKKKE